jgi:hypothetical protein
MSPSTPRRGYCTYLLRYWEREATRAAHDPVGRYVVERVSDVPERWVFSSLPDLLEFLCLELGDSEPGLSSDGPPDSAP